ncbi:MAG TPA: hypothetical protein VKC62_10095 [Gaiellaceae bacterium]|nr:hypothetical protein [Gaiellaceae bacterium]
MRRRRFVFLAVLLVALNASFWLAASVFALPGGGFVQALFGRSMVRADVIWMENGKVSDTRVDRGVVTALSTVAPASVTLRERDGSSWTIPLAATVTVRIGATVGTLDLVHKGVRVVVTRPATGSADTIVVEGFGP